MADSWPPSLPPPPPPTILVANNNNNKLAQEIGAQHGSLSKHRRPDWLAPNTVGASHARLLRSESWSLRNSTPWRKLLRRTRDRLQPITSLDRRIITTRIQLRDLPLIEGGQLIPLTRLDERPQERGRLLRGTIPDSCFQFSNSYRHSTAHHGILLVFRAPGGRPGRFGGKMSGAFVGALEIESHSSSMPVPRNLTLSN